MLKIMDVLKSDSGRQFLGWLGLVAASMAVLTVAGQASTSLFGKVIIEGAIYLCLFSILSSARPVREIFASLDRFRRGTLLFLLAAAVGVQLVQTHRLSFPLVGWGLYSHLPESHIMVMYSYEAHARSGRQIPLVAAEAFPSLQNWAIPTKLHVLLDKAARSDDENEEAELYAVVDQTIAALALLYPGQPPSDPLVRVDVFTNELDTTTFNEIRTPSRTWARTINLEDRRRAPGS